MKTVFSKITNFSRNVESIFGWKSLSEFVKNLSMWFFNDQVGNDKGKQFIHYGASSMPLVLNAPFSIMPTAIFGIQKATKSFVDKFHESLVSINNLKSRAIVDFVSSFPSLDIDRAFTVKNAREINDLFLCPHGYMISERELVCHRKRLNPETSKEDAIV